MKLSFLKILGAVTALVVTQSAFATSPDYILSTSTGASIVPGTDDIGLYDDDGTQNIALPFSVMFYDQVFNSVNVSTNGNLQFITSSNSTTNCLATATANNVIAPFWADLYTRDAADGQGIFTSVSGVSPNRIFNIEWRTKYCCGDGVPDVNFEVRLYEGQRQIDFIYGSIQAGAHQIGIGVQRDTGSQSTVVSCGTSIPPAGTQYTFTIPETCMPAPANMIAWWPGDGNANDIEGNHHGVLLGGASFATGKVQQAFSFDGVSGHIEIPDSPSLNPTSQITIDAWVKTSAVSRQALVSKFNESTTSPDGSYDLAIISDSLLEFRLDNVGYVQASAAVCDGQWHHVAGTYDGTTISLYVDGVLAGGTVGSGGDITVSTRPLYLGAELRDNADSGFLNGQLDEVEIFNRALTPTEIAAIYGSGSAGKCHCTPPPANMISWWPGEGDGTDIQGGNNVSDGNGNGSVFGSGEVGKAFTFDGSQFATAGTPSNLAITTEHVTIDGWINPSVSPSSFTLLFGHALSGGHDYALVLDTDLQGVIKTDNGDPGLEHFVHTGYNPPLNTWTHVALTYDGSTITVYANGVVVGSESKTGNISNSGGPFNIGGRVDCCFYTGAIDEVEVFDRTLSAQEIASIYHAGSAGKCRTCIPAPTNLVGWWPGDGDLTDIQGGHNGTSSGGGPSFSAGEVLQAIDFNGSSDFFTADNVPDPNQAFTFDCWLYWRGSDGNVDHTIVYRTNPDLSASYFLGVTDSGSLYGGLGGDLPGFSTFNTNPGVIPTNQWVHVALSFDGVTATTYVNGQVQSSLAAARNQSSATIWFGSYESGLQFFLNGEMDEIEIFSRALTQSEVQAIYDAGSGGKCKPAVPAERQLFNISSRASVGTGDDVAIGGFIIQSDPASPKQNRTNGPSTTKRVLIRGIGPSLAAFSVPNPLQDPVLSLYDINGTLITTNDNWGDAPNASDIQATGFAPSDPSESAILSTLNADASYTAILSGKNNTTGIGLVEVYDMDVLGATHLINISTRGFVDTGDNVLIGGLIVQGGTPTRIVVRAIGPSLQTFGISDALPDPALALYDANGVTIASNDDWASSPDAAAITAAGLNPSNSKESAILFTPAPGSYTAIVSGNGPTSTGVGLVEAFWLGPP